MLTRPLASVEAYVEFLSGSELPVLRLTRRQLEQAAMNIDNVSGKEIARIVLRDPLMTVKVLNYIQPYRGKSLRSDITTVDGATVVTA